MPKVSIEIAVELDAQSDKRTAGVSVDAEVIVNEILDIGTDTVDDALAAVEDVLQDALRKVKARAAR